MGLKNIISSADIFGHPVSFKFKGSSHHTTLIGGILSILVRMGAIYYFFWRLQDIEIELKTILDLLGNVGGIYYIVETILIALLQGISEHSFTVKAIQKLFYAQTKSKSMFLKSKNKKDRRRSKLKVWSTVVNDTDELEKVLGQKVIKISTWDSISLFFTSCCAPSPKLSQLFIKS